MRLISFFLLLILMAIISIVHFKEQILSNFNEEELKPMTANNDAGALFSLGINYSKGSGVMQDHKKAFEFFAQAADLGLKEAQHNLAHVYENGIGVEKDSAAAMKWYTKAANQGLVEAQFNLGQNYLNGDGVEQDFEQSFYWFTMAAEQGYPEAQLNLGIMFGAGYGVDPDADKAIEWFTRAAEQGQINAQYNMGVAYECGDGVEMDYQQAAKWYGKAAEQGHDKARESLEKMKGLNLVKQNVNEYQIHKQLFREFHLGKEPKTTHTVGGKKIHTFLGLLIVSYPDVEGFYLIYLDANKNELTDTYHESIEGAMKQAEWEFNVRPSEWTDA